MSCSRDISLGFYEIMTDFDLHLKAMTSCLELITRFSRTLVETRFLFMNKLKQCIKETHKV